MKETQEDCLTYCQDTINCKWFTFDQGSGSCTLFSQCTSWDGGCKTCISGEQDCSVMNFYIYTALQISTTLLHLYYYINVVL